VAEARTKHLQPYRFQPGKSGSAGGMTKSEAEFYREARALAHQAGPGAIRRLMELAGVPVDPDSPWRSLEQLDIDARVVYMAAQSLVERAYGKPREYDPNAQNPPDQLDPAKLNPEERAQLRATLESYQRLCAIAAGPNRRMVR
jgi:hypothetical protein